jgi:hypothetical protein
MPNNIARIEDFNPLKTVVLFILLV